MSHPTSTTSGSARVVLLVAWIFLVAYVGLQFVASTFDSTLWGLHVPGFLPGGVGPIGWVALLVGGTLVVLGRIPGFERWTTSAPRPRWGAAALAVVVLALLWSLRVRHDLLGDAYALTQSLPVSDGSHPRQPLTQWIQRQLFEWIGPWVYQEGMNPADVARRTVAWGSVLCGVAFVFVARGVGREIVDAAQSKVSAGVVALVFVLQGWSLLFFGYLENYTFLATVLAAWILFTLRALRTGGGLASSSLLLVTAVGLHLSVAAFTPLLPLVWALHFVRHRAPRPLIEGVVSLVSGIVVLHLGLRAIDPGFSLLPRIADVIAVARQDQGGGAGLEYLLSAQHVVDWFNAQMLLGPVGSFVGLIVLIGIVVTPARHQLRGLLREPGVVVLAAAGLLAGAAHWSTVEPALGYARDWDLFAPTSVFVTAAATLLLLRFSPPVVGPRLMALALLLSLWHTGTWVALNASATWSVERFASLDLGLGRTEVVLARHHLQHGDDATARRWLRKALQVNPSNNNAWAMLADLDAEGGDVDRAIRALENARDARPRKPEYHRRLVELLSREGRNEALARALERWLAVDPAAPDRWLALAQVRLALGDQEGAMEALGRSVEGYETVFAAHPDVEVALRVADGHAGLGNTSEAIVWYRRALDLDPQNPTARARLATLGASPR